MTENKWETVWKNVETFTQSVHPGLDPVIKTRECCFLAMNRKVSSRRQDSDDKQNYVLHLMMQISQIRKAVSVTLCTLIYTKPITCVVWKPAGARKLKCAKWLNSNPASWRLQVMPISNSAFKTPFGLSTSVSFSRLAGHRGTQRQFVFHSGSVRGRVHDAVARDARCGPDGREAVPRGLASGRPALNVLPLVLELRQHFARPEAVENSNKDTLQCKGKPRFNVVKNHLVVKNLRHSRGMKKTNLKSPRTLWRRVFVT